LDLKKDLYSAVGSPRIHHQLMPNRVQLEVGFDKEMERELARRGHQVSSLFSITCKLENISHYYFQIDNLSNE
jgi:gamma-glutamyltranspeptidase/glutathione hydrolase/leukotriene-C4 hydrolase